METKIINQNAIIAEFMNKKDSQINKNGNGIEWVIQTKGLKYHSDWNWLMEVVEKIDYLERNTDNEVFIQKISNVTSLPLFTPKHTVYNACVEFIKFHNEQTR